MSAQANQADVVRDHFDISDDRNIGTVTLGYADRDHSANGSRTEREAVDVAVSGLS